jgi:hypothetical protein
LPNLPPYWANKLSNALNHFYRLIRATLLI